MVYGSKFVVHLVLKGQGVRVGKLQSQSLRNVNDRAAVSQAAGLMISLCLGLVQLPDIFRKRG